MDNRQPRPEAPMPKSTDAIDHQIILLHLLPHERQHFAVSKVNKLSTLAPQASTLFHSIEILGIVQSQDRDSREPFILGSHSILGQQFLGTIQSQISFHLRTMVEHRHGVSLAHNPSWEVNCSFTCKSTNKHSGVR